MAIFMLEGNNNSVIIAGQTYPKHKRGISQKITAAALPIALNLSAEHVANIAHAIILHQYTDEQWPAYAVGHMALHFLRVPRHFLFPLDSMLSRAPQESKDIIHNAWLVAGICSIPVIITLVAIKPLLLLAKQDKILIEQASPMFYCAMVTLPLEFMYQADIALLVCQQKKRLLSGISIMSSAAGVGLTYALVPQLGLTGYAIAASCEQIIKNIAFKLSMSMDPDLAALALFNDIHLPSAKNHKELWHLGAPIFVDYGLFTACNYVVSLMVGHLGHKQVSVFHALALCYFLVNIIPTSISRAGAIFVGQLDENQHSQLACRYGNTSLAMNTSYLLMPTIAYLVVPEHVLGFFIDQDMLIPQLRIVCMLDMLSQWLFNVVRTHSFNLQAFKSMRLPAIINAVLSLMVMLPLAYNMTFEADLDLAGTETALCISSACMAANICGFWYHKQSQIENYVALDEEVTDTLRL